MLLDKYDLSDLVPIELPEETNFARINHTKDYLTTSGYLVALMAKDEHSQRALDACADMIDLNPAHYTAYEYRLRILKDIGKTVIPAEKWPVKENATGAIAVDDIEWVNSVTLENGKNYQIWNYRQNLYVPCSEFLLGEEQLIMLILEDEPKNYHAWLHLQWVYTKAHSLQISELDLAHGLEFIQLLLTDDVYNNSAWAFRYFLLFEYEPDVDQWLFDEISFIKSQIEIAPQNESPWNFLKGLLQKSNKYSLQTIESFLKTLSSKSTHAMELLADMYKEQGNSKLASDCYEKLQVLVPIRSGYWTYMQKTLAV